MTTWPFDMQMDKKTQFTTLIVHPRRAKGAPGEVIWPFGQIWGRPHRINMIDLHIAPLLGGLLISYWAIWASHHAMSQHGLLST